MTCTNLTGGGFLPNHVSIEAYPIVVFALPCLDGVRYCYARQEDELFFAVGDEPRTTQPSFYIDLRHPASVDRLAEFLNQRRTLRADDRSHFLPGAARLVELDGFFRGKGK